jgi:hypothetical protein
VRHTTAPLSRGYGAGKISLAVPHMLLRFRKGGVVKAPLGPRIAHAKKGSHVV